MQALRRSSLVLLAVAAAAGVGCGNGDEDNQAETPATTTSPATTTPSPAVARKRAGNQATSVRLDEYTIAPADLLVKRGDRLDVSNDGAIAHNLKIEKDSGPDKKTRQLAGTPTFLPGKTKKLELDLRPGEYSMVCTVPGHRQLGMTGTITVK